jgi:hypothetical protein
MQYPRTLLTGPLALVLFTAAQAQTTLKDGTSLTWDKEITVATDSLRNDSVMVPALKVPIYESTASQVSGMLKTVLPGAGFKKQGDVLKAPNAPLAGISTPMDILAAVNQDKKQGYSTLSLAFLQPGTSTPVENPLLEQAVRNVGVQLNKAVVQQQLDTWKKKLGKADSRTQSATKDQAKAQGKLDKAQAQLQKYTKEKSKLQNEHALLVKEVDLLNQKWTLSQDPKDLKKLTKARAKITKNEASMAKAMDGEAGAQKDITKYSSAVPDAQQAKDQQAAAQAEVQRTVDALQRKLDSIR